MNNLDFSTWIYRNNIEGLCRKRHRIIDYEPGHVRYQFGHYPCRKPYQPDHNDWKLLDLYAQNGLRVIHLWQWNDWLGFHARNLFQPMNPAGVSLFVSECHKRGLKVIPYTSPGFFDVRHPEYNPAWESGTPHLREVFYDLGRMCPGSPGWRNYYCSGVKNIMDNLGFDGIYWDAGFPSGCSNAHGDGHTHFEEYAPFADKKASFVVHEDEWKMFTASNRSEKSKRTWKLLNEFLSEVYSMVKSRNGIVVAHIGGDAESPFKEKFWDYQLLGEGVTNVAESVRKTAFYRPYILRFNDWSRLTTNPAKRDYRPDLSKVPPLEHLSMAMSIPYMQFPWLEDGNYGVDEDLKTIPGVKWIDTFDIWTEWAEAQRNAGFPPVLGASLIAGRERYFKYLRAYRNMTAPGTAVYLEIGETETLPFPASTETRKVSVFVNDCLWVVISNLGQNSEKVNFRALSNKSNGTELVAPPGKMIVLKYSDFLRGPEIISFE